MTVHRPDQGVRLDMVLSIVAVIVIIGIEKGKEKEKGSVIAVIVSENVENEQFAKGIVNVIDVGKEKEKKNHLLEEGNL